MRPSSSAIRVLAISLVATVMLGLIIAGCPTYAELKNPQYEGVRYRIIAEAISTPSGTHNIPFDNTITAKPHLYNRNGLFNVKFSIRPYWDGDALAAAYVPASLEKYKDTNPKYQGEIISYRPTNIGLIAVFRGSQHHGTLPRGGDYWIQYKLHNGTMHLSVAIRQFCFKYIVKIILKKYDVTEAKIQAWIKARAGISAKLKFLNFINAGFNLAQFEAGVRAHLLKEWKVEEGYEFIIEFSIPTYKYKITYTAGIYIVEDYNAKGNGLVPTSGSPSSSNVVSREYRYNLWANGVMTYYSDYEEITAFVCDDQFKTGGTTGIVVFDRA